MPALGVLGKDLGLKARIYFIKAHQISNDLGGNENLLNVIFIYKS